MRRFAKIVMVLLAVTMVVAGGCKRDDVRPFTRHMNRPAYNGPITNNTVIAPVPAQHVRPQGKVIQVPGQYNTLQEAAQHAYAGDTIDLAAGLHSINDTVIGWDDVTLRGAGADTTEVLWDGAPNGTMLRVLSNVTIENLTMRGGTSVPSYGIRGALQHNIQVRGVNFQAIDDDMYFLECEDVQITDVITRYSHMGVWFNSCTNVSLSHNSLLGGSVSVKVENTVNCSLEENIFAMFWNEAVLYDWASETTLTSNRNSVWNGAIGPYYVNMDNSKTSIQPRGTDFTDNPILVNPYWGDFRISPMSPCLTAGIGGKRIGSRMHRYAQSYQTDLFASRAGNSPLGIIPQSAEAEVLYINLTADSRGEVIIPSYSDWEFAISFSTSVGAGLVKTGGNVSLKNLDTNQIVATQAIINVNQTQVFIQPSKMIIPAGQTLHLALTIDSSMMPMGVPFMAGLKQMEWSDGRIQYIQDGRIPEIDGCNVQF